MSIAWSFSQVNHLCVTPITILERIFNFSDVRNQWGIDFEGIDVEIISNKESFYELFAELIKRIINKADDRITTRTNKEDLPEIFESLPSVSFQGSENEATVENDSDQEQNIAPSQEPQTNESEEESSENNGSDSSESPTIKHLKGNPHRNKILLPIYSLNTDSYRLRGLFYEFTQISISRYPNHISSSLRVFLDLAVFKYIETEGLESAICQQYQAGLKDVALKKRLEFLKSNKLNGKPQTIVNRLIDPNQQYSLDVLNGYIHSQDTHYTNKQFLNGFWDFLFPLFQELLDISENQ